MKPFLKALLITALLVGIVAAVMGVLYFFIEVCDRRYGGPILMCLIVFGGVYFVVTTDRERKPY